MTRANFIPLLFISVAIPAEAARVHASKHLYGNTKSGHGPHKCTITWPYRDQVAQVSFGVPNCMIHCKWTTDYKHDNMFPAAFTYYQGSNSCICKDKANGNAVLKFPGGCPANETDAGKKCWDNYKVLSTNTYEAQFDKDTLKTEHHEDYHHWSKFKYDDPPCQDNGCQGDEDCFTSQLPSLAAGRSPAVKEALGKIMMKIANGEDVEVDRDTQALLDGLTEEDKEGVFFAALPDAFISTLPEDERDEPAIVEVAKGPRTVRMVKQIYEKKLDGTGVSVDHLLRIAGFNPATDEGLNAEVTEEAFKKFLKPECDESD